MMHVIVSPFGRVKPQRLAATAVAYVTDSVDGAVVHLIGGEQLRVRETCDQVEQLLGWRESEPAKPKTKPVKAA
jgi:hypothetical protein